jgi:hypothetical protein
MTADLRRLTAHRVAGTRHRLTLHYEIERRPTRTV